MKRLFSHVLIASFTLLITSMPALAGLDVYAGSLEKFYKNDYLSTQAQTAKELGMEFNTVYPDGEPEWLTNRNAAKKVKAFRKAVRKKTSESSPEMSNWTENNNDYLIEQLNWDSLSALIHLAAYSIRTDLERSLEFSGDYEEYPAFSESVDNGYYMGPLAVLESDMFLPSKGTSIIIQDNPMGYEIVISTTENLKNTLKFLEKQIWKNNAKPDEWFDRGPANVGKSQEIRISDETGQPEIIEVDYPPIKDVAKYNAEYAYSVLLKVLTYSEKHNVPLAMDG